jgi:hypothetical protein
VSACGATAAGADSGPMRFIDYLRRDRLVLDSGLPPETVAQRLDDEIGSIWAPFSTGVVGWVAFGRFNLVYRRHVWLRNHWIPVLSGRIRAHRTGSRIIVRYGIPPPLQFLPFAFILAFVVVAVPPTTIASTFGPWLLLGLPLAIWVVISVSALDKYAEDDLVKLLAVVQEAAGRSD